MFGLSSSASWTYVPSAGAALADWGADVIKVEGVASGDPGRALVVGGFTRGRRALTPTSSWSWQPRQAQHRHRHQVRNGSGIVRPAVGIADVFLTNWLPGRTRASPTHRRGHPRVQPQHHHRARYRAWGCAVQIGIAAVSTPLPTSRAAGWRTR